MSVLSQLLSPSPLPTQTTQATDASAALSPTSTQLTTAGQGLEATGSALVAPAEALYRTAAKGELTAPQQAAVTQATNQQTAQAVQMYESMGRNPSQDTSFLNTEATIQQNAAVMANTFIQSTIALAGQMMTGASSIFNMGATAVGEGLSFATENINTLMSAAGQQISLDQQFAQEIGSAFQAVGTMAGLAMGNPASISKTLSGLFGGSGSSAAAPTVPWTPAPLAPAPSSPLAQ